MPGYQQLSVAATTIQTTVETLVEFGRLGWIKTVEKNGTVYVAATQRYRAKYILHLRDKMKLTDDQIQYVLSVQQPPYSAAQVEEILRHGAAAPAPGLSRSGPHRRA